MRTKGISPIEQHAEKIVLGVVAAAAVGALVLQFISGRATVKVGTRQEPIATAFRPVEEAARQLQSRIDSDAVQPPEPPAFTLAERLKFGPSAPGYTGPRVALGPGPAITLAVADTAVASATYALPAVPAPSAPLAIPYSATIHPAERILHPDLALILPKEQPYDMMAVSLECTFDGTALRAALERDPEGPTEPIPMGWWRDIAGSGGDLVAIVSVEVERELIAAPEGVTPSGPATLILPPLPGRFNGKNVWQENVRSAGDVSLGLEAIKVASDEIERPEFYEAIEGPKWEPPSVFLAKGDPAERRRQVDLLWRRWTEEQRRIQTLEEQLKNAPQEGPAREPRQPAQPTRGPGGGGKGGPGATPSATQPRSGTPERTGDRGVIERNLKQAKDRLDVISKRLTELGETVEGYQSPETVPSGVPAQQMASLLDNPSVTLWAHDVTGMPGATYRYRTRVVINNPLFDRNLQEGPQRDLGKESLLVGGWSEWSAPITVDPRQAFFITSAEDRSAVIPSPHASAEVFEFYYGYYRVARATLEPGDSVSDNVKLPELRFADLAKLEELIKRPGGQAETPSPPAPGRGPAGPGRNVAPPPPPSGPGRIAPPQPVVPSAGAAPTSEGSQIQWPDWMPIEAPKTITLSVDAVFLGITSVPTDTGAPRNQAVLRLANGTLLAARPEVDRNSAMYRRLDGLARIGLTQGREPARIPEPPRPLPGRDRDRRRPGDGGGGGGGGGGG